MYNEPDDINENHKDGNSPFAVLNKCIHCDELPNDSGYCAACELLILEGEL